MNRYVVEYHATTRTTSGILNALARLWVGAEGAVGLHCRESSYPGDFLPR